LYTVNTLVYVSGGGGGGAHTHTHTHGASNVDESVYCI